MLQKEERKPVLNSCFMTSLSGFKYLGRIIVTVCVLIYNNSPTNTKSLDLHSYIKALRTPAYFCQGGSSSGSPTTNDFV